MRSQRLCLVGEGRLETGKQHWNPTVSYSFIMSQSYHFNDSGLPLTLGLGGERCLGSASTESLDMGIVPHIAKCPLYSVLVYRVCSISRATMIF